MSDRIIKETALTINFVGENMPGFDKSKCMDKVMELLGAPKFGARTVQYGWDIVAPNGELLSTHSTDTMEFIKKTMFGASITDKFKESYEFDSYQNKEYISKTFFTDANGAYSAVGSVWSGYIEVITSSFGVTKSQVDKVHKSNVLAVKDRIVAMKHVLNVAYTCTLRKLNEVECSVD